MNQNEFGALVRALREDHLDEDAHKWTRKKLSEEMSKYPGVVLNVEAIGKIERGERSYITPQELVALSNALQLTTVESQEFFYASTGTDNILSRAHDNQPSEQILKKLTGDLQGSHIPFFICDQFNDIVAANQAIIRLVQFTPEKIREAAEHPIGFNTLRIVFDPAIDYKNLIGQEVWEPLALFEIQWFRGDTLRYRNHPYFKYLLKHLLKFNEFRWRWREVYWAQEDWYGHYQVYSYDHPQGGKIRYGATHSRVLTPAGSLTKIMYIPHSQQTSAYFESIMQNSGENIQLFPTWPNKKM